MAHAKVLHMSDTEERLQAANTLLYVISRLGRCFFRYKDIVAQLELDRLGTVWWHDHYTDARVNTRYSRPWRDFSLGHTLEGFVAALCAYVTDGRLLDPRYFGIGHGVGDPWGYKEDMEKVRYVAIEILEMVQREEEA